MPQYMYFSFNPSHVLENATKPNPTQPMDGPNPCLSLTHTRVSYVLSYDQPLAYTHPFNGPLSGTTRVSQYQKGKTNLDFTKARDSEWQWHQLGHMQVCTLLQTNNRASTPLISFLQAGCPSCHPTNSVKALNVTTENSEEERKSGRRGMSLA